MVSEDGLALLLSLAELGIQEYAHHALQIWQIA